MEDKRKRPKAIPPQVKFQAVLEVVKGERGVVETARAYSVHRNTLVKWKPALMEKGPSLFAHDTRERELEKKVQQLAQHIRKKEVEIAFLKNFLGQGR